MDEFPKKDFTGTSTAGTSESASFRFRYVSVGPGTVCPTCGEKTPNEHALEMRRWRAKRKEKRDA